MNYYGTYYGSNELYHYGVKGMKWGVRRYQNEDGSLKTAGQRHRSETEGRSSSGSWSKGSSGSKKANRKKRIKRALGLTAAAAAAAGLAYGGYKLHKNGGKSYLLNRYRDAKAGYKDSKFGRKVATEKFKAGYLGKKGYAKDVLGRAKTGAVNTAYRAQERATLLGRKAGNAIKSTPQRAKDTYNRARIKYYTGKVNYYANGGAKGVASRAKDRTVNAAYRVGERASLYGHKAKSAASRLGSGAKSTASNALSRYRSSRDERRLVGSKLGTTARNAGSKLVDTGYRVSERASLYGRKARSAASTAYDRAKRKRMAKRARLTGF